MFFGVMHDYFLKIFGGPIGQSETCFNKVVSFISAKPQISAMNLKNPGWIFQCLTCSNNLELQEITGLKWECTFLSGWIG